MRWNWSFEASPTKANNKNEKRKSLTYNKMTLHTPSRGCPPIEGAKEVPGFDGAYLLTRAGELYRVRPYTVHTKNEGWQKRLKLRQVKARGKSQMVCLSYQGRRLERSINALVLEIF